MEEAKRARKGSGCVYQPTYEKDGEQHLGTWRVKYVWRGKRYNEKVPEGWPNTKTGAQKFLKKRFGEQANGEFSAVSGARELSYEDLRDGLLEYYELNDLRSLKVARDGKTRYLSGQSHLDRHFKGRRAIDITTAEVDKFVIERRRAGASNANTSVSVRMLRRMFSLAVKAKKFSRGDVPTIKPPKEHPARKGFLEPRDFPKLHDAMPADLRLVLQLGFDTGMRRGEVQNLRWRSIDLIAGEIRLTAEETKTAAARTVPLGRMLEAFRRLRSQRPEDEYVFGRSRPLGSFRKRWAAACVKAGFGRFECVGCGKLIAAKGCEACESKERKYVGLTFHDLRRSAVRNLVRGGTPQSIAMDITGHKTMAVFKRYNITDTRDIHAAIERTNAYVERSIRQTQVKVERSGEQNAVEENSLVQ